MFSRAHGFALNVWKAQGDDDSRDYDTLCQFNVAGASHDSVEKNSPIEPDPEVYSSIVSAITSWCGSSRPADSVLWLYGPPASGKSTITYTVAEHFWQKKKLAGSFFFCSSDSKRNNTQSFVATLSYQMTQEIPITKRFVTQAISGDPSIFSKSIEAQAELLIFKPLQRSRRWFPFAGWPKIMVIDGLDECYDIDAQISVLRILQASIRGKIPLRFLLSSQISPHIRDAFDNTDLLLGSRRIGLDDFQKDREDIKAFFRDGFAEILRKHRKLGTLVGIPKVWPPPHVLERLVFASWGHPIYATTALKFIDSTASLPTEKLDLALSIRNLGSCTPLVELDLLYKQVLSSTSQIRRVMEILRALFVLQEQIPASELEILLESDQEELNLLLVLEDLHSVLNFHGSDGMETDYITFHHISFPEFLLDRSRSGEFFVDVGQGHVEMTRHCIRLMEGHLEEHRLFALGNTILDRCICYAVRHWQRHLLAASEEMDLLDTVGRWDMSQWGRAILSSRVLPMEPLMRITEALSSLQNKNYPRERLEALSRHILNSVDHVFKSFLDEHRDIAPTVVAMMFLSIPKDCPDYALQDITKSKRAILWTDTLMHLMNFQYFREFITDPARSGQYFCGAESHSRAFMMLLNYVRSPVLHAFHSLDDDEAFYYAMNTAGFHLNRAAPTRELVLYLKDVLSNPDLFSETWRLEESYRPDFRKFITLYLDGVARRQ